MAVALVGAQTKALPMPSSTIGASTDQTAESGVIRVDSQTSDTMIEGTRSS